MNREQYTAAVGQLNRRKPGDNLEDQKFPRGARVKVADEMPSYMSHFDKGFEAIVQYTYGQKFGGFNTNQYSLIYETKDGYFSVAWYEEDQLTLISDDTEQGMKIIEAHHKQHNIIEDLPPIPKSVVKKGKKTRMFGVSNSLYPRILEVEILEEEEEHQYYYVYESPKDKSSSYCIDKSFIGRMYFYTLEEAIKKAEQIFDELIQEKQKELDEIIHSRNNIKIEKYK